MGSVQFQNWNCLFKKNGIRFEVGGKTFIPQINLPFNFLILKYFFHDNPTWKYVLEVGLPSRYSGVPTHGKK